MAEEEHIAIKRESVAREEQDQNAGQRPVVRAMFRISDRNNNGNVTKTEMVDLMNNFGFAGLEDGDEDWVELEDDEDVSFDEFFEWWSIDGTFKYTGGGIYATVKNAYKTFKLAGKDNQTVSKSAAKDFFKAIGASSKASKDAVSAFDKADKFEGKPAGSISFEAFAQILQDCPDAVHALLRKHTKTAEQQQYRGAEKTTARAMFSKFDPTSTGAVPASVLDTLLTDYGIGKVDMSDEDMYADIEFDGIFAWWSQEGRYVPEEPTKGVVGVRGLLYAHKHFVEAEAKKGDDSDLVNLKDFYQYLLHANISEWNLQLTVGCLEVNSEKDVSAAVPLSFANFVARIGNAPANVILLLQKSAAETLPVASADDLTAENDKEPAETYDVPATETTTTTAAASKPKVAATDKTVADQAGRGSMTMADQTGERYEPKTGGFRHYDKDGQVHYCNNTPKNWLIIIGAVLLHWTIIGLIFMGLVSGVVEYGVDLLYIFLIGFCVVLAGIVMIIIVGAVDIAKQASDQLVEDKPVGEQNRRSMVRSKATA
jgi:Ca2+-binding EF-hand superfamily protein